MQGFLTVAYGLRTAGASLGCALLALDSSFENEQGTHSAALYVETRRRRSQPNATPGFASASDMGRVPPLPPPPLTERDLVLQ